VAVFFAEKVDGFLIICDLDGELFSGLQARIESGGVSTLCGQIHTGIREGTLRHGMRACDENERHDGTIARGEVRGAIHQLTTGANLNIDVCRVAGRRRRR